MMSIEAFVSFTIFLVLALFALAVRWLNERIRRDIALSDLKDLFLPSDDAREQQDTPKRRTASRLRLGNKADLRQGIIIMTVLGPCRALEHPDD
jgi:hypothetical protein